MRTLQLLRRNLSYYWPTHLAVVFGVATAVAVLTGALAIGDSVRASLRGILLNRLGSTDLVISVGGYAREQLAKDLELSNLFSSHFQAVCPLIMMTGVVTHQENRRRAFDVQVYGVDDRFWIFHGKSPDKELQDNRSVCLSPVLRRELGAEPGDSVLLRVQKPSAIPAEFLQGRREDTSHTLRLDASSNEAPLAEFSVRPQQTDVRAVFVSLRRLQKELQLEGKINTLLVAEQKGSKDWQQSMGRLETAIRETFRLEDVGVKVRILERQQCLALESESALINQYLERAGRAAGERLDLKISLILTYLANTIRCGPREVPYSLVSAVDKATLSRMSRKQSGVVSRAGNEALEPKEESAPSSYPLIILNDWTAKDLGAKSGDTISLDYYIWEPDGQLVTRTAQFRLQKIVPLQGLAVDPNLTPEYPGITGSETLSAWDPPFPMDLGRIQPRDEAYWHQYKTTPKAFVPIETGQALWQSRFGRLSSLRFFPAQGGSQKALADPYRQQLKSELDPFHMGLSIYAARGQGLEASRGATDFGEYFLYFSFFLVASALLLTALFFRLGVEQRLQEIGLLRALGFSNTRIRFLFFSEGLVLALLGSIGGVAGAVAYGQLIVWGLRHWWTGAVGTTQLAMHLSRETTILGAAGGILTALVCITWTLRSLAPRSPRSLLSGPWDEQARQEEPGKRSHKEVVRPGEKKTGVRARKTSRFRTSAAALVFGSLGLLLLLAVQLDRLGQVAGFFGAGTFFLVACLCQQSVWVRRSGHAILRQQGWRGISRLGLRNVAARPARAVLCVALIASAAFIIVSVEAFRQSDLEDPLDRKSGTGGYPLLAESVLPIHYNLNTNSGRESLNFDSQHDSVLAQVQFSRFRVRPGDDASCLNLYEARNPRILAVTEDFVKSNRFTFQDALASNPEEKANPWLLLAKGSTDGKIPVIADANSMTYVLHRKLGDTLDLNLGAGPALHLQFVAALSDSLFQGELLMSEENFVRLFPDQQGYRFFLMEMPLRNVESVTELLEDRLSDFGFDVISTTERLAAFHRVENTYLSTFQSLGTLGLMLGTLGLASVLLRNVLERRRELALLRAVGYRRLHLAVIIVAENLYLLVCGLVIGAFCAGLAIAPAILSRRNGLPVFSMLLQLAIVLMMGATVSVLATRLALRTPLLPALRRE